jgi:hypothetical protein
MSNNKSQRIASATPASRFVVGYYNLAETNARETGTLATGPMKDVLKTDNFNEALEHKVKLMSSLDKGFVVRLIDFAIFGGGMRDERVGGPSKTYPSTTSIAYPPPTKKENEKKEVESAPPAEVVTGPVRPQPAMA